MRIVRVTLMAFPTLASLADSELTPGVNVASLAVEGSLLRVGLLAPLADGTTQLTTPLERVREIRWAPDAVVPTLGEVTYQHHVYDRGIKTSKVITTDSPVPPENCRPPKGNQGPRR